jgi:hypothetical protein
MSGFGYSDWSYDPFEKLVIFPPDPLILIDHGGRRRPTATWGPTPGFKHTIASKHTMEQVYVVKTRKKLSSIMFIS